jgi:transcriptional regulator with XRE-family HTH domain
LATNLQIGIEQQRALYDYMPRPLLSQLAELHRISVRDFAAIFGISKSHAEEILNHKKLPALELAIRVARYWECSVEDLFGWRVDDEGSRRPLLIELPSTGGKTIRLNNRKRGDDTATLIRDVANEFKKLKGDA